MTTVAIGGRRVGLGQPSLIVAEMSANHDQSLERALRLVDLAAEAGADAIKLQTYTPDTITINTEHPSARIDPVWGARNLYELYRKAYMPWEFHAPLFARAAERGILAFSSPFDRSAVELLEKLDAPAYKIASFELLHLPLLRDVARTGKPVILSTGMATMAEVGEALETLDAAGSGPVILLHCCSSYPATPESVNLGAMDTLRHAYGRPVGFSDHTVGTAIPLAAVARGACLIEKHFTDDPARPGPDHRFSASAAVLREMVAGIRAVEAAAGDGRKVMQASEKQNRDVGRRSIFACVDIAAGTKIAPDMVRIVRPGAGLAPRYLEVVIGRTASRFIRAGYPLTWGDL